MPLPILQLRTLSLNAASKAQLSASSLPLAVRLDLKAGRRMRGSWVNMGVGDQLFGEIFLKNDGSVVSQEEKDYARITLAGWEGWDYPHGPWSCIYTAAVGWPQPEFTPGSWLRVSSKTVVPGFLNSQGGLLSLVALSTTRTPSPMASVPSGTQPPVAGRGSRGSTSGRPASTWWTAQAGRPRWGRWSG